MKIVHLTDQLETGGKERRLIELLKGLKENKHIESQIIVLSNNISFTEQIKFNVKIHSLKRKMRKDPLIFLKLYQIFKKLQPDIIHTWESMCSVYAAPIAKLMGIKFFNGMITTAPLKIEFMGKSYIRSKLTFPFSDIVISNSYAGLKSYRAPANKSYCIHNGFDFSRIKNITNSNLVRNQFRIQTKKVVGMVARFETSKDYETFIKSAIIITQKRNDITFLAIGDGTTLNAIKMLIPNRFSDRIRLLEKQKDIESIVNIFDIGVLTTYTEGISNSIMEYMALSKPVIATKGGGTNEIVMHEKTGFLIDPYDITALTKKIEYLIDNEKELEKLGKAGMERLSQKFNVERMTNTYIDLYQKSIKPRNK